MKSMTFGKAKEIKPNKSVQAVLFNNEIVGWLYTYCKNFLCPIEETFWSINLTKEQADKLNIKYIESEDNGFYQATLHLRQSQQYTDLYVISKKIYYYGKKN